MTKDGKRFIIPSRSYQKYEKESKIFIPLGMKISDRVNVKAEYYMRTKRRVDLNNLHNALHDILVKYEVLTDDNYKIIAGTDGSRVYYDKDNPRTVVTIEKMEEE